MPAVPRGRSLRAPRGAARRPLAAGGGGGPERPPGAGGAGRGRGARGRLRPPGCVVLPPPAAALAGPQRALAGHRQPRAALPRCQRAVEIPGRGLPAPEQPSPQRAAAQPRGADTSFWPQVLRCAAARPAQRNKARPVACASRQLTLGLAPALATWSRPLQLSELDRPCPKASVLAHRRGRSCQAS